MFHDPIEEGFFKRDVMGFYHFAFDPFMAQNLLPLCKGNSL